MLWLNNVFIIGVDAQKANTYIHHANSQIWNGLGKIEEVAKLVPYNLRGVWYFLCYEPWNILQQEQWMKYNKLLNYAQIGQSIELK